MNNLAILLTSYVSFPLWCIAIVSLVTKCLTFSKNSIASLFDCSFICITILFSIVALKFPKIKSGLSVLNVYLLCPIIFSIREIKVSLPLPCPPLKQHITPVGDSGYFNN